MKKIKFICIILTILLSFFLTYTVNANKLLFINEKSNTVISNDLSATMMIRENGGEWVDESISTKVGTIIEFKINVLTQRQYEVVAILVNLPLIEKSPMFNYDWGPLGLGSSEPKPFFPIGEWSANNTDVVWAWFVVDSSWSKDMTFKAGSPR